MCVCVDLLSEGGVIEKAQLVSVSILRKCVVKPFQIFIKDID